MNQNDNRPRVRFSPDNLRAEMARAGITAGALSEASGVSEQTIYNMRVAPTSNASLATLTALARGLGIVWEIG